MTITTISKLSSGISFGIPDNSMLILRLYCSGLAWYFSWLMIHFSSFVFTFSTTTTSLLIFLFVECSWDIVSFSFDIWLIYIRIHDNLSFQSNYLLHLFRRFYGIYSWPQQVNKLVLWPILIWFIWQVHVRKWDLDFKTEFLHFWIYVFSLRMFGFFIHQDSEESKSREVSYSSEDFSSLLRDISRKNMNRIKIFQLNVNSIRRKFDLLVAAVVRSLNILLIT